MRKEYPIPEEQFYMYEMSTDEEGLEKFVILVTGLIPTKDNSLSRFYMGTTRQILKPKLEGRSEERAREIEVKNGKMWLRRKFQQAVEQGYYTLRGNAKTIIDTSRLDEIVFDGKFNDYKGLNLSQMKKMN